jgi:hypothetical protein
MLTKAQTMPAGWCKRHPTAIVSYDDNWCGDHRNLMERGRKPALYEIEEKRNANLDT